MRNLSVVIEESQGFQQKYSQLLYTDSSFLNANNDLPQKHFWLVEKSSHSILAHFGGSLLEGTLFSPYKAPFGGFSLGQGLSSSEISFFILEVMRMSKESSIRQIQIKLAPACYQSNFDLLAENLGFIGFQGLNTEEYQAIKIDDEPLKSKMADMERRRLKKCEEACFEFRVLPNAGLSKIFEFVKKTREAKKYAFSMSWPMLKSAYEAKSSSYLPIGVFDGERLIAATIAVLASDRVIYNFCPAHDPAYDQFSPIVFLTDRLYQYGQENGFSYLDLGTSYLDNRSNDSLRKFKQHLGAQNYLSKSFQKVLN